jgi:hypothetical protein
MSFFEEFKTFLWPYPSSFNAEILLLLHLNWYSILSFTSWGYKCINHNYLQSLDIIIRSGRQLCNLFHMYFLRTYDFLYFLFNNHLARRVDGELSLMRCSVTHRRNGCRTVLYRPPPWPPKKKWFDWWCSQFIRVRGIEIWSRISYL